MRLKRCDSMMKKVGVALCVSVLLGLCEFASSSVKAQVGGGIGLGQYDLIRQVRETASAMRKYRCEHSHYPSQTSELDDALRSVFRRVALSPENPSITPQSRNNFRTYYQFAIAFDQSIRAVPIINGRVEPPNSWQAFPNTIVIFSDGANMFAVWASSGDQRPINDPTTGNPLVIIETTDCGQSQNGQNSQ